MYSTESTLCIMLVIGKLPLISSKTQESCTSFHNRRIEQKTQNRQNKYLTCARRQTLEQQPTQTEYYSNSTSSTSAAWPLAPATPQFQILSPAQLNAIDIAVFLLEGQHQFNGISIFQLLSTILTCNKQSETFQKSTLLFH